jgi:hypothetical protein
MNASDTVIQNLEEVAFWWEIVSKMIIFSISKSYHVKAVERISLKIVLVRIQ